MRSASKYKDIFHGLAHTVSLFFYLTCIATATILSLHLISNHTNIRYTNNFNQTNTFFQPNKETETCDLFIGQWIPEASGPLYTNYSCTTIPVLRNCFLHGRKDRDFLHWRWKPEKCELPRFSAQTFLSNLRGKKLAFIGDSLARNHMESLLCLLSTAETPKLIEKDADDKFITWGFLKHNFTLMVFWSPFLVTATESVTAGSFDLHLDRPDNKWSEKLPSIDYAVFNSGHWLYRVKYLYEGGNVVGCVNCHAPNITEFGPGLVLSREFRAAFKAINECNKCNKTVSFLRTRSPDHFEMGMWNTGGRCNRTTPILPDDVDRARPDWEYRNIQVKEVEAARNEGKGRGNEFEVIDVTEMMSTRVDGHPGLYWGYSWTKGNSDCLHWCMPGPADTWNDLLLQMIIRISSRN